MLPPVASVQNGGFRVKRPNSLRQLPAPLLYVYGNWLASAAASTLELLCRVCGRQLALAAIRLLAETPSL